MAFTSKDSASKTMDLKKEGKLLPTDEIIKGLKEDLKIVNEENIKENIKLKKDLELLQEKKDKAEEYIRKLTKDLKERKSILQALRKELQEVNEAKADTPTPENDEAPQESNDSDYPVDSICGKCKGEFSGAAGLVKDKESPHYLSVKCSNCGKLQNAEAAAERYLAIH